MQSWRDISLEEMILYEVPTCCASLSNLSILEKNERSSSDLVELLPMAEAHKVTFEVVECLSRL